MKNRNIIGLLALSLVVVGCSNSAKTDAPKNGTYYSVYLRESNNALRTIVVMEPEKTYTSSSLEGIDISQNVFQQIVVNGLSFDSYMGIHGSSEVNKLEKWGTIQFDCFGNNIVTYGKYVSWAHGYFKNGAITLYKEKSDGSADRLLFVTEQYAKSNNYKIIKP